MTKYRILLFILVISLSGRAQNIVYPYDESAMVIEGGNSIRNPWAGGFNSAQYSSIDLNNDGILDLVVFDRSSNRLTTFLVKYENSHSIYVHEPRYEKMFPAMSSWLLLVDYNNDGRKDIFTHANLGIKVFKNTGTPDTLTWQLIADPLNSKYTTYSTNIYVSISDIPAIEDIDNDGDLDILNFNFFSGESIEFHKNVSQDSLGTSDSLFFKDVDDRWGAIKEGTCNYTFTTNSPVPVFRTASTNGSQHIGAAFLALKDIDGDGDKEAFISKETCDIVHELTNKGTSSSSLFNSFTSYPPATTTLSFKGMPGAYFEDLDFDGIKDLVATPSLVTSNSNTTVNYVDFQHSSWFYKNTGSNTVPSYKFVQKDFLQNNMIELGENASPAFADYDADGDLDMFIANKGLPSGVNVCSSIRLYENTGNSTKPEFNLINSDYLSLSTKKYTNLRLAFSDLNGDNALDIIFTGYYTTTTSSSYTIKYILNTNSVGQAFNFNPLNILVLPLDAKNEDIPCFYDVDNDGKQDVLLAKPSGKISYYNNIGSTSSPAYMLAKDTLGGITVDAFGQRTYLSVTVADLDANGSPDLITADNSGMLRVYQNFQSDLLGIYTGRDLNPDSSGLNYSLGKLLSITSADLNNDSYPEFFIGNNSGGVCCLNKPGSILNPTGYVPTGIFRPQFQDKTYFTISPNPSYSEITISASEDGNFTIIDMLGNTVREDDSLIRTVSKNINVDHLKEGIYLVRFHSKSNKSQSLKLIILK